MSKSPQCPLPSPLHLLSLSLSLCSTTVSSWICTLLCFSAALLCISTKSPGLRHWRKQLSWFPAPSLPLLSLFVPLSFLSWHDFVCQIRLSRIRRFLWQKITKRNEPSRYKTDEDKRLQNCQSRAMCSAGYGESTAEYPVVREEKLGKDRGLSWVLCRMKREEREEKKESWKKRKESGKR